MDKTSKLSDKELRFCHEYIKDGNGTRSAIAAGYTGQKLSMAVIASRLLIKANIVSKIEALRVMHATKIQISAEKILQELAKIAFANLQDYYKPGNELCDITTLERDKSAAIDSIKLVKKTGGAGENAWETQESSIKLCSKQAALESLGKHLALFTDNVNTKVTMDISEATQFNVIPKSGNGGYISEALPQEEESKPRPKKRKIKTKRGTK